jgi:hypothetical protein
MLRFVQNTQTLSVLFGSAALIALISATPVTPASAQAAPAGLLRLDPPQPSNDGARQQLTEEQRAKVRSAYARSRKNQANQ